MLLAVFALMAAAPQPAPAMPNAKRLAKACQSAKKKKAAARTAAVARPTPIRVREARKRARSGAVPPASAARSVQVRRRVLAAEPGRGQPRTPPPRRSPAPREPAGPRRARPGRAGAATTVPEPPSNPFAVQVLSGEFFLQLSKPEVHAGNVRVEFNNRSAEDPHDLHVFRAGRHGRELLLRRAPVRRGRGEDAEAQRRHLAPVCALPEHAERGMSAKLRVVDG